MLFKLSGSTYDVSRIRDHGVVTVMADGLQKFSGLTDMSVLAATWATLSSTPATAPVAAPAAASAAAAPPAPTGTAPVPAVAAAAAAIANASAAVAAAAALAPH